jgi:hypothetical protein
MLFVIACGCIAARRTASMIPNLRSDQFPDELDLESIFVVLKMDNDVLH